MMVRDPVDRVESLYNHWVLNDVRRVQDWGSGACMAQVEKLFWWWGGVGWGSQPTLASALEVGNRQEAVWLCGGSSVVTVQGAPVLVPFPVDPVVHVSCCG